jgi:hypothetical protein
MTTTSDSLASTIHDAIDEVTTAVEDIHRSIAEVPRADDHDRGVAKA